MSGPVVYDESGVDRTLIEWSLSLTPAERLDYMHEMVDFAEEIWRLNGIEPYRGDPRDAD